MRLSIKRSNQRFLQMISDQMECDSTEALNYLLTELRRVNYSFNGQISLSTLKPVTESYSPIVNDEELIHATGHLREIVEQELAETDPTIKRLLTVGLDEF